MAPRNSQTKPFRRYRSHIDGHSIGRILNTDPKYGPTISDTNNAIMTTDDIMNNKFYDKFEAYKAEKGLTDKDGANSSIMDVITPDEEGDPRYMNTSWYQEKIKGVSYGYSRY